MVIFSISQSLRNAIRQSGTVVLVFTTHNTNYSDRQSTQLEAFTTFMNVIPLPKCMHEGA